MNGLVLVAVLAGLAGGSTGAPGRAFCAVTDVGVPAPPVQPIDSAGGRRQTRPVGTRCRGPSPSVVGVGLEWLAAELAIYPCPYVSLQFYEHSGGRTAAFVAAYAVSTSLMSGSSAWAVSRLLGEKRAWWKAAAGSAAGSVVSSLLFFTVGPYLGDFDDGPGILLLLNLIVAPAVGAVVGLNL